MKNLLPKFCSLKLIRISALICMFCLAQVSGADYRYQQDASSTRLTVRANTALQAKVLGAETSAHKIVIKLSGGDLLSREEVGQWQIPERSGLAGLRVIPYNRNKLLIIELLDKLPFRFQPTSTGFSLTIADGDFRNPTEFLYRKGLYHHNRGELQKALNYYRRVALSQNRHAYAYFKAGQIRLSWKDYRKAEINFRKALQYGCDSSGVYNSLAELYERTGKTRLADQYRQKYLKMLPRSAPQKKPPVERIRRRHYLVENQASDSSVASTAEVSPAPASRRSLAFLQDRRFILALGISLTTAILLMIIYRLLAPKPVKTVRRSKSPADVSERQQPEPQAVPQPQKATPPKIPLPSPEPEPAPEKEETVVARPREMDPRELERVEETLFRLVSLSKPDEVEVSDEQLYGPGLPRVFSPGDALLRRRFLEWEQKKRRDKGEKDRAIFPKDISESADESSEPDPTRKIAKELNIGVGELELALNLSAKKTDSPASENPGQEVLRLAKTGMSVEEISRRTRLGKSEVELLLNLHRV